MTHRVVDLDRAIERLRESDTQGKRRNARRNLWHVFKALQRDLEEAFPPLDRNGTPRPRRSASYHCPICKIPFVNLKSFVAHLQAKHQLVKQTPGRPTAIGSYQCPCGAHFTFRGLAGHFSKVGDLRTHFAEAVMNKASGIVPEKVRRREKRQERRMVTVERFPGGGVDQAFQRAVAQKRATLAQMGITP